MKAVIIFCCCQRLHSPLVALGYGLGEGPVYTHTHTVHIYTLTHTQTHTHTHTHTRSVQSQRLSKMSMHTRTHTPSLQYSDEGVLCPSVARVVRSYPGDTLPCGELASEATFTQQGRRDQAPSTPPWHWSQRILHLKSQPNPTPQSLLPDSSPSLMQCGC
jgi:hypothetical protein